MIEWRAPLRTLTVLLVALALWTPVVSTAQADVCAGAGDRGFGGTGLSAGDRGFGGTGLGDEDRGFGGTGLGDEDRGFGGTGERAEDDRGFGGTGERAEDDRGFGGTGERAEDDRGFGGTGLHAGVYGTVTGFGSICVNGLRIRYDAATAVERGGRPIGAGELAQGQSVVVDAAWRDGSWHADRIAVQPAISGPVTAVDAAAGRIEVMGEPIGTAGALGLGPDALQLGDRVSIHGLRDFGAGIAATRIERAPVDEPASVVGRVSASPDGGRAVGSIAIRDAAPAPDAAVRVAGVWDASQGALVAFEVAPALDFAGGIDVVSVEARVGRQLGARFETPLVTIDAARIAADVGTLMSSERIWAEGRLNAAGILEAERIAVEPRGGGLPEPTLDQGWDGPPGFFDGEADSRGRGARDDDGFEEDEDDDGSQRGGHGDDDSDELDEDDGTDERDEDDGSDERDADDDRDVDEVDEPDEDDGGVFSRSYYDPRDFLEGPELPGRGDEAEAEDDDRRSGEGRERGEAGDAREREDGLEDHEEREYEEPEYEEPEYEAPEYEEPEYEEPEYEEPED